MTPINELELSGIVRSPSSVFLIMSSAEQVSPGEHIAVPFEGRSRAAKVEECMPYRDRYLLWTELVEDRFISRVLHSNDHHARFL